MCICVDSLLLPGLLPCTLGSPDALDSIAEERNWREGQKGRRATGSTILLFIFIYVLVPGIELTTFAAELNPQ